MSAGEHDASAGDTQRMRAIAEDGRAKGATADRAGASDAMGDDGGVSRAPAPWNLQGAGYVILLRLPQDFAEGQGFIPPAWRDAFCGGMASVMVVRYLASDVGPYDELLFVPGRFQFGDLIRPSVTRILVSSEASVVNGRANWGIPKALAEFQFEQTGEGRERVTVSVAGAPIADLHFRRWPLSMPFSTALIPRGFSELIQAGADHPLLTALKASGQVGLASLTGCTLNAESFPDLNQCSVLASFHIPRFSMTFPVAKTLVMPEG